MLDNQNEQYDPVNDPFHPEGKPCATCGTEYDDEEWGIIGWIGIIPVSFCVICLNALEGFFYDSLEIEDLESMLEEKRANLE
jgi:hypothetical protein